MILIRKIYILAWVLCACAIVFLSLATIEGDQINYLYKIPYIDKIVHFIMYAALTAFGVGYIIAEKKSRRLMLIYVLSVIAMGGLMELFQPFTHRNKDLYDFLSNTAGVIFATALVYVLRDVINHIHDNIKGRHKIG